MLLSCVTDEISMDFEEAIRVGTGEGVFHYELRTIAGYRFPDYPPEIINLVKKYKDRYSLNYSAVSPGIFKRALSQLKPDNTIDCQESKIFHLAHLFEVERIIIFAYTDCKTEDGYQRMIEDIRQFVKKAKKEELTVSLENSPSTCCRSHEDLLEIVKDVGENDLHINWDPANSMPGGYGDHKSLYQNIIRYMDNMHIKDVIIEADSNIKYVPIGEGIIDYKAHIKELKRHGYKGCLTVETHCKPALDAFIKSVSHLKKLLKEADVL